MLIETTATTVVTDVRTTGNNVPKLSCTFRGEAGFIACTRKDRVTAIAFAGARPNCHIGTMVTKIWATVLMVRALRVTIAVSRCNPFLTISET